MYTGAHSQLFALGSRTPAQFLMLVILSNTGGEATKSPLEELELYQQDPPAGAQNIAQFLKPTTAINLAQNLLYFPQIDAELRAGLPFQLWPHFGTKVPISLTRKRVLLEVYST